MARIQPNDEIGWQSERTHSAWGPTYRVVKCGWCAWDTAPDSPIKGRIYSEAANGEGLVPRDCPMCGGEGWYAELVGPPPPWIFG